MVSDPQQSRSRRPPAPLLVQVKPRPELPRPLRLEKLVTIVGSKEDADVCLPSQKVSGAHAVLINRGNYVYVRDLVSRTGTRVNDEALDRARRLTYGDQLRVGEFEFRFYDEGVFRFPSGRWHAAPAVFAVEGSGEEITIDVPFFVIGRRDGTDLALTDHSVSSAHAAIVELDGRRYVCDLNSRTGTTVNGIKVRCQEIVEGDVLGVGTFRLRCVSIATEEPADSGDALSSWKSSRNDAGDDSGDGADLKLADEPAGDAGDSDGSSGGVLAGVGGARFAPLPADASFRSVREPTSDGERRGRGSPSLSVKTTGPVAPGAPAGRLVETVAAAAAEQPAVARQVEPPKLAGPPVTPAPPAALPEQRPEAKVPRSRKRGGAAQPAQPTQPAPTQSPAPAAVAIAAEARPAPVAAAPANAAQPAAAASYTGDVATSDVLSSDERALREQDPWREAHGPPEQTPATRRLPVDEILAEDNVVLLGAGAPPGEPDPYYPPPSLRRRTGGRKYLWAGAVLFVLLLLVGAVAWWRGGLAGLPWFPSRG